MRSDGRVAINTTINVATFSSFAPSDILAMNPETCTVEPTRWSGTPQPEYCLGKGPAPPLPKQGAYIAQQDPTLVYASQKCPGRPLLVRALHLATFVALSVWLMYPTLLHGFTQLSRAVSVPIGLYRFVQLNAIPGPLLEPPRLRRRVSYRLSTAPGRVYIRRSMVSQTRP